MNCKCWCCLTADPIKTCFTADPIKTCFTGYTQETPATSLPFVMACSEGVLLGCANVKERAIVYFTGHFPFGVRVDGRGRGREGAKHSPPSLFFTVTHPLSKKFLPLPSLQPPLK